MSPSRRLRICYIVPGHRLVSSMGPTRNVLNLARALQPLADVTVAFRHTADAAPPSGIPVMEIVPGSAHGRADDAATSGMGNLQFLRYLVQIRRFVERELVPFDIVLEKSWLLSGYVSALCSARGQLGVPVENIVQNPHHAARGHWLKLLRMKLGSRLACRSMRQARLVIAETEFLRHEIHRHWEVPVERIAVVPLGVDRNLFHPLDQAEARRRLDLRADATILTYVGVLDWTHNLEPVLRALAGSCPPDLELHIIGDGARRAEYEALARASGRPVRFYGKVPHDEVPWHIAAADLCLAPYDSAAFASGELGYSTLKIPEYLSVGRPVASVASGRIRSLITDGQNGFLFRNTLANWEERLATLPSRARLAEMGAIAARDPHASWEDTARAYYELCLAAWQALPARRGG
jgi:glycosyltransferase involved in cell wall biosynthesis